MIKSRKKPSWLATWRFSALDDPKVMLSKRSHRKLQNTKPLIYTYWESNSRLAFSHLLSLLQTRE